MLTTPACPCPRQANLDPSGSGVASPWELCILYSFSSSTSVLVPVVLLSSYCESHDVRKKAPRTLTWHLGHMYVRVNFTEFRRSLGLLIAIHFRQQEWWLQCSYIKASNRKEGYTQKLQIAGLYSLSWSWDYVGKGKRI